MRLLISRRSDASPQTICHHDEIIAADAARHDTRSDTNNIPIRP
jgi:hypothetical protein